MAIGTKIGGSAAHDVRRAGTVSPPEHHPRIAKLSADPDRMADPDRPHGTPSAREERRAAQRERRRAAKHQG